VRITSLDRNNAAVFAPTRQDGSKKNDSHADTFQFSPKFGCIKCISGLKKALCVVLGGALWRGNYGKYRMISFLFLRKVEAGSVYFEACAQMMTTS